MSQPYYTSIRAGTKVIGKVSGGIFFKTIAGSKHILRTPPAIAVDMQSLRDAEAAGARVILITDRETGATYQTTIQNMKRHGFTFDRGYGHQLALELDRWHIERPGEPVQLSMFGRGLG